MIELPEERTLIVGARQSPLSQAQVREVYHEIHQKHPSIIFHCVFVDTHGDKDLSTSLRDLGKTDFFTREIDEMLLSGKCRIAIHSAKDLPDPLVKGVEMVALTRGLDSSDVLVLREGKSLETLPAGALIGVSSDRREEAIKKIRSDLAFVDIRGTIGQRLSRLAEGSLDGIVTAEAALIRLGLTHLNRIKLDGCTTEFQGQLAVLARSGDRKMQSLFASIDVRA